MKNNMKLRALFVSAVLALNAGTANAIIIDFYDESTVFATLTTSGTTDFLLTLAPNNDTDAFVNDLSMAGPNGTFTNHSTDTVATGTYSALGFVDAGETYNWLIDFPNANNRNRFTPGESAMWSIVTTDPDAWTFNLIHINAFDGIDSIKLLGCVRGTESCGPPVNVPEPVTLLLLGSGLLALVGVQRRKLRT